MFAGGLLTSAIAGNQLEASIDQGDMKATISVTEEGALRTYQLSSDAPLRDNRPEDKRIVFSEPAGQALVRSGNLMFDGLYAMAVHEALQNSVPEIRDNAYADGTPIRLDAFQTGEYWTYVWTRDLSYSVNLGLAAFDPQRSMDSLLFKTSGLKSSVDGGLKQQIIQDTGSGGSYPVSTDRVVWALGAWETLKYLSGAEREMFLEKVYSILHDTIEQDRVLVYDPKDGLYRGEQSFLDWREQTYPGWTSDNVLPIALSKSLSVNVLNFYLLTVASECAGYMHEKADAKRYAAWAEALKDAINRNFYNTHSGLYSTYLLSDGLCSIRAKRYDLLGESLAILFGVADSAQSLAILDTYPVGPHGPSVVWPQERTVPIYHNQGIWPFVTAYWVKAARKANHSEAVNLGIRSMERLAAFNLSNMENFDFVSGLAEVKNKPLTGPVINSRRQLWSVAGYLSMVQDIVFGLDTSWDGIRFQPYVTAELRNECFADTNVLELRNFTYHGTRNNVRVHLPAVNAQASGALSIRDVVLNGKKTDFSYVPDSKLKAINEWVIYLQAGGQREDGVHELRVVDGSDARTLYGPVQPRWTDNGITLENGRLKLRYDHPDAKHVVFNIYRDGQLVGHNIKQTEWVDEASADYASVVHCYAVEAQDPASGNASHLTPFGCYTASVQKQVILAKDMKNRGGDLVSGHHFENWGEPKDELTTKPFEIDDSGDYAIRAEFANGSGPVNTGITCAVKAIDLLEGDSERVVSSGYLIMPQSGNWNRWDMSSPFDVELKAGKTYRLRIYENEYARNMSYLEQNKRYTAWPGGGDGGYNFVNIASLQLERLAMDGATGQTLTSNP